MTVPFRDRVDAGRQLARELVHLRGRPVVVLGLPRGGVPVAAEVADALQAPLDVILVRKLGVPVQPELGMGAIGEDGARVLNDDIVRAAGVSDRQIAEVEARERAELDRRAQRFRGARPRVSLDGRIAVVVDDGIATGSTARAACLVARAQGAGRVVLAVPVAPPDWRSRFTDVADELVAVATPEPFHAIGPFYVDFSQTPDDEVVACLDRAAARGAARSRVDVGVTIAAGSVQLEGRLSVPPSAGGVIVFAHGSGSSRHSSRNRQVAGVLADAGFATLLFDLLTDAEASDRANVFDVELLASRLAAAISYVGDHDLTSRLPVGLFGASTGAAAALWTASEPSAGVAAVVSRGGRPDLAGHRLGSVQAPTLLIVGSRDEVVLDLNRHALAQLTGCEARLTVIDGATHLFEEPGTLDQAAAAAKDWFVTYARRT